MRREGADQERRALAAQQLLGDADGVTGIAIVVAAHDLDLAAEHTTRRVHFLDRQLDALLVGLEEGWENLVAVKLADLDRCLRGGRSDERQRDERGRASEQAIAGQHEIPLFVK